MKRTIRGHIDVVFPGDAAMTYVSQERANEVLEKLAKKVACIREHIEEEVISSEQKSEYRKEVSKKAAQTRNFIKRMIR